MRILHLLEASWKDFVDWPSAFDLYRPEQQFTH